MAPAAPAHASSDVEQPRHVVVSNTIWVVFYLIRGLPSNRRKVEASAQPKDSHDRHKNTQGHGRLHKDR